MPIAYCLILCYKILTSTLSNRTSDFFQKKGGEKQTQKNLISRNTYFFERSRKLSGQQQLTEGVDYEVVGGTVVIKDHIKIPTNQRPQIEWGGRRVVSVRIVPARGPDVSTISHSASVGGSNFDLLYRGKNNGGGRRAPRRLPQI